MRAPNRDLEIVCDEPGVLLVAGYQNVNVVLWLESATGELVKRMDEAIEPRAPLHPDGVSTVHIAAASAGLPSKEARDAFAESVQRWLQQIAAVAVVIEREGFWGSAMRSAVTGIQMLAPAGFPMSVHRTLDDAASWLVEPHKARTGVSLSVTELKQAMFEVRELGSRKAAEKLAASA